MITISRDAEPISTSKVQKQRLPDFKEGLKRAGIKLTHQRLEIFREVANCADHPDAETIFKGVRRRVPTVSLDTVYRTLWMLVDLGLITTLGSPRERLRFDANMAPHHHFICAQCGLTRDFTCGAFDRLEVPDSVRALGRMGTVQVEVRGVCLKCSKKTVIHHRVKRKKEER